MKSKLQDGFVLYVGGQKPTLAYDSAADAYIATNIRIEEGEEIGFKNEKEFGEEDEEKFLTVSSNQMEFTLEPDELQWGMYFPVIINLPPMKQLDFVISVCAMAGVFATPGGGNSIKFISMDSIVENKKNAVDWSEKLLRNEELAPSEISFMLNDFAQKNYLKYKEDESVEAKHEGVIRIADSKLEYSRDLAVIGFSPSDEDAKEKVAVIPLYEPGEDSAKPELISLESIRILRIKEIEVKNEDGSVEKRQGGTFEKLDFQSLIAENYQTYESVIKTPVYIKEKFLLGEYDLLDLDYSRPVYLSQYGAFFAIIRLQANSDGICECELLKL